MQVVIFETMLSDKLVGHEVWVSQIAHFLHSRFDDQVTIVGQKKMSQAVCKAIGAQYCYDPFFTASHLWRSKGESITREYCDHRNQVAVETAQAVARYASADVHIFPAAVPTTAAGVAMAAKRATSTSLLFHFSHFEQSDKFMLEAKPFLPFYQQNSQQDIRCFTTSPCLATEFIELGITALHAPYPCYFSTNRPKSPQECRRVGLLGHQRAEKDGGLLLPLINTLLGQGFEVVCQDSGKQPLNLTHPNLHLAARHVAPSAFRGLVDSCDVVLITNESTFFKV